MALVTENVTLSVPKKMFQDAARRAGEVVGSRCVVRVVGCRDERLPVGISLSPRVPIVLPFMNRSDRPPEIPVPLAVPGSDDGVGHRQVGQGEQPRTAAEVVTQICVRDAP
jgi:hypothetical protein